MPSSASLLTGSRSCADEGMRPSDVSSTRRGNDFTTNSPEQNTGSFLLGDRTCTWFYWRRASGWLGNFCPMRLALAALADTRGALNITIIEPHNGNSYDKQPNTRCEHNTSHSHYRH